MDIKSLMNRMTIEEKLGQMTQLPPHFFLHYSKTEVYGELRELPLSKHHVLLAGSVLGIRDAKEMMAIQTMIMNESRLNIPALFMADVIHGYETIFPIPLAQAASFNPSLVKQMNQVAAIESSTSGIHVTFAPMVDLSRDARWGRVMEGYGEDPLLASRMAKAAVDGFHVGNMKDETYVASCIKHFAGYGAVEAGRDYNTVDMSYERFYNIYAPSYQAGIDAGAEMAMMAFNTFNGVPATMHEPLIQSILKNRMGFNGITISDYDAVHQLIAHGAVLDDRDAAKQSINAGLMIEMASNTYLSFGNDLALNDELNLEMIDEAVYKILKLKDDLGLFENPFKGASLLREQQLVKHPDHVRLSETLSYDSPVLLKNDGVLPLDKNQKYALIGAFSSTNELIGAWHWHGKSSDNHSYMDVFKSLNIEVKYQQDHFGTDHLDKQLNGVNHVLIMCGEVQHQSGESKSKVNLDLDPMIQPLITYLQALGKKVIVIVHGGRPLNLTSVTTSNAIMMTWFLGSRHAEVVTHLLFGDESPSGKLPMSFPRHVGQYPMSYHDFSTGRPYNEHAPEYVTKYLDVHLTPLYEFGHGLVYHPLKFMVKTLSEKDTSTIDLTISIENVHEKISKDTLLIYANVKPSNPVWPTKKLIDFHKVTLDPKSTMTIELSIHKQQLTLVNEQGNDVIPTGNITLFIGFSPYELSSFTLDWRAL